MVAIGTGGRNYAKAFIEDEQVPFDVLLDEDGAVAEHASMNKLGVRSLTSPAAIKSGLRSRAAGHKQRKAGRRPMQLGATLVVSPGDVLLYSDYEDHAGDHADIDEILAVLNS